MSRRRGGGRQGTRPSILDDLPRGLPALARAERLQALAARAGFDWPDILANVEKIEEETAELREALRRGERAAASEELGDLLLALVNVARAEGIDAERCLAQACEKFERRFRALEARLAAEGRSFEAATLADLDAIWNRIKLEEESK